MNRTALRALLKKHEGMQLKPYTDTVGKLTIGVGRNLTDKGLATCEVSLLLDNDINDVWQECSSRIEGFTALDDTRQHVLLDMAFNMGIEHLLGFHKMLVAVQAHNWELAVEEMLNSKWAKQVGNRATDLAHMMRQEQE